MKVKSFLFAALAAGLIVEAAGAAKMYEFYIQDFKLKDGVAHVVVKAVNQSGKFASGLAIRCEFKDQSGKTLDVGWRRNLIVAAGKSETFTLLSKKNMEKARSVKCSALQYGY
ncbi:hypothetical protein SAZ10_01475 [Mesorhizobium sp. BAC0120]|uniref:hypothetical protein n=1 Tax=Mesorhizobium sp. BAC0120 TaxID=3090670 RepID=UPI00298BE5FF|nr:hypothetical protein [Mesorhizobium sp. BAC0120]MDW6020425.1 hypothetical protein [Mesorhizobium sp. BAC0120]